MLCSEENLKCPVSTTWGVGVTWHTNLRDLNEILVRHLRWIEQVFKTGRIFKDNNSFFRVTYTHHENIARKQRRQIICRSKTQRKTLRLRWSVSPQSSAWNANVVCLSSQITIKGKLYGESAKGPMSFRFKWRYDHAYVNVVFRCVQRLRHKCWRCGSKQLL